jgi:hypothetical protein
LKTNILVSAALVAVGVMLVGTLSVTASHIPPSKQTVIRFRELNTGETYVPVQKLVGTNTAANNGDYLIFQDPLVDPSSAKRLGTVYGVCLTTDVQKSVFYCPGVTFVFDKEGTLTSAGAIGVPGRAETFGIFGGTGKFSASRGTLRASFGQASNDWTLRLKSS